MEAGQKVLVIDVYNGKFLRIEKIKEIVQIRDRDGDLFGAVVLEGEEGYRELNDVYTLEDIQARFEMEY